MNPDENANAGSQPPPISTTDEMVDEVEPSSQNGRHKKPSQSRPKRRNSTSCTSILDGNFPRRDWRMKPSAPVDPLNWCDVIFSCGFGARSVKKKCIKEKEK